MGDPRVRLEVSVVGTGWAKNSVNCPVFRSDALTSWGPWQFCSYFDEEARVVVASRHRQNGSWTLHETPFGSDTADAHNAISLMADDEGYLHMAWSLHAGQLSCHRTVRPGDPTAWLAAQFDQEGPWRATYPQFVQMTPGALLLLFRHGHPGAASLVVFRYQPREERWSLVHQGLIDGRGKTSPYWQAAARPGGGLGLSWVWRDTSDVASNHDLSFAQADGTLAAWETWDGKPLKAPIVTDDPVLVWPIPPVSDLINQTTMDYDHLGRPWVATYWRTAEEGLQYRLIHGSRGGEWEGGAVSQLLPLDPLAGRGTKRIPIARPLVAVRRDPQNPFVVLIWRETEADRGRIHGKWARLEDPTWHEIVFPDLDIGYWEPSIDHRLWESHGVLSLFVQPVGQGDSETLEERPPSLIQVYDLRISP